jgi:YegS/Rv2252/BmrU family lipid kinase
MMPMAYEPRPRYAHVPVIVNPASGPDRPVLKALNAAFHAAQVDWDIFVTKREGDAFRFAQELREKGAQVIAVCGGDGTVKEAARALAHTNLPFAILPGGTGNAMAVELGIPLDLSEAARLACDAPGLIRPVDMGQIGEHLFILRASMGLETELLKATKRQMKDQLGGLAYPLTALQQVPSLPFVNYRLTVDGALHETTGVGCSLANSAQMGVSGLTLAQGTSVSDGLLDVVIIKQVDVNLIASLAASNLLREDLGLVIEHWQGAEITVESEPPQEVAFGERVIAQTPVTAHVVPGALRIIVPDSTTGGLG